MDIKSLIGDHLDRILNFWLVVDSEERIVHCCRLIYEHLGYSASDLLNQPFQLLFPNDDSQPNEYVFNGKTGGHTGTIVNHKTRIRQKNGIIMDVELSAYHLDQEEQSSILIAFENITEVVEIRKIVKSKTEHLNRKFHHFEKQSLYEPVKDMIDTILVSITAGQGLKFNRGFLFLIDEDREILCGIRAIGPGSGEEAGVIYSKFNVGPDTLTEMISQYRSQIDPDSAVNQFVQSIEIDLTQRHNVLIKAINSQRYILVNDEYPLINDPGTVWLRHSFDVHESVVIPMVWHGRSIGVVLVDNQVTKARISNFDIKKITKFIETATNSLESTRLLYILDKSVDQLRLANLKIRESQEILLQKEKLAVMGELVAHMAHEVRGPLATIGGYASRIQKQLDKDSPHLRSVSTIVEAVETLELVIKDILDGSIPLPVTSEGCDCTKAVNKVLGLLEEEIHKRKISVSLNIQGNLPKISIREHQLFEIFNNLIRNAIEAIGADGILLIVASGLDDKVTISVQDTGPGIPDELMGRIYSPFFTTKEEGTGLGLVVVKKLVEENNGSIEIHSKTGQGTTITISFPIGTDGDTNG